MFDDVLFVDTETRCNVDVRKVGAYRHRDDASAKVLITCVAPNTAAPAVEVEKLDSPLLRIAWNAAFDRLMLGEDAEMYLDCADLALALSYPMKLEKCAEALHFEVTKDPRGQALITKYSSPKKATKTREAGFIELDDNPEDRAAFVDYCGQDVMLLRSVYRRFRFFAHRWVKQHRANSEMIRRMNERGIPIDTAAVTAAVEQLAGFESELNDRAKDLTGGISLSQVAKLKEWMENRLNHDLPNGIGKDILSDLLEEIEQNHGGQSEELAAVVQMRLDYAKASTKKLLAMERCVCRDGTVKGCFVYHRARTGRCAGRLIQPQNFPRSAAPDGYFDALMAGGLNDEFKDPIAATSQAMRGFIRAPKGKRLIISDYGQIECRVLAWMAQEHKLLRAFERGVDVYKRFAATSLYHRPEEDITPGERTAGKVGVLSCGYGVGAGTLKAQAKKQFGLILELGDGEEPIEDESIPTATEIVWAYRSTFAAIPALWERMENWAFACVMQGNPAGPFRLEHNFLICTLPSGRELFYVEPKIQDTERPWGAVLPSVTYMGTCPFTTQWRRLPTYGGKLVENVVQAIAADIMYHGLANVERLGYEPIMTVHDEIVSLCWADADEANQEEYDAALCDTPAWAKDVPIIAEGSIVERYTK